jgi:hypothetical protein
VKVQRPPGESFVTSAPDADLDRPADEFAGHCQLIPGEADMDGAAAHLHVK